MDSTLTKMAPMCVLVVDDHPNTATTLARAIAQIGPEVEVISANSAKDALECVRDGAVDFVITDLLMPDVNGLELIEKLQAHPAGKPTHVILMTAYDVPGLKLSAQRLKVDEVIIKPVRPDHLCEVIRRVLKNWRKAEPPKQTAEPQPTFKILVADDQADNIALLSRYLSNEGYVMVTAIDGMETLEKARTELPDLILLDVNMPKKDGFEVLKEIRTDPTLKFIPVIILTAARIDPLDMQSGLNLGADDYITKPFERHELIARIRTKLRVKQAEDEIRKSAEQMIQRQDRLLFTTAEIASAIISTLDLNKLLFDSVELIQTRFGFYYVSIFLIEPGSDLAVPHASANQAGVCLSVNEQLTVGSNSFIGKAIATRKPLVVMDVANDSMYVKNTLLPDTQSEAVIPLVIGDSVIGALDVQSTVTAVFNDWDITILTTIANQLAIAVQNAWFSAAIQREVIECRRAQQAFQFAKEVLELQMQGRTSEPSPSNQEVQAELQSASSEEKTNRPP